MTALKYWKRLANYDHTLFPTQKVWGSTPQGKNDIIVNTVRCDILASGNQDKFSEKQFYGTVNYLCIVSWFSCLYNFGKRLATYYGKVPVKMNTMGNTRKKTSLPIKSGSTYLKPFLPTSIPPSSPIRPYVFRLPRKVSKSSVENHLSKRLSHQ